MILELLVGLARTDHTFAPGDQYECSDVEAQRLIAAGVAVPMRHAEPERAVVRVPELAVKRTR